MLLQFAQIPGMSAATAVWSARSDVIKMAVDCEYAAKLAAARAKMTRTIHASLLDNVRAVEDTVDKLQGALSALNSDSRSSRRLMAKRLVKAAEIEREHILINAAQRIAIAQWCQGDVGVDGGLSVAIATHRCVVSVQSPTLLSIGHRLPTRLHRRAAVYIKKLICSTDVQPVCLRSLTSCQDCPLHQIALLRFSAAGPKAFVGEACEGNHF